MTYPINYPTPQNANFQPFYGGGSSFDWVKPVGVTIVRMLLIGGGAGGRNGTTSAGGTGGGSGAITSWIGPAMFIPDILRVSLGAGGAAASAGGATSIIYQCQTSGTGYTLLTANGAASQTAGTASSNNFFGASGIFRSVAGQAGSSQNKNVSASTSTFLSGGAGGSNVGSGYRVLSKYGYPRLEGVTGGAGFDGDSGWFQMQPIMFGYGGNSGGYNSGGTGGTGGNGGIGCGGGGGGRGTTGGTGGRGGDGAVFIWSW